MKYGPEGLQNFNLTKFESQSDVHVLHPSFVQRAAKGFLNMTKFELGKLKKPSTGMGVRRGVSTGVEGGLRPLALQAGDDGREHIRKIEFPSNLSDILKDILKVPETAIQPFQGWPARRT
jgi:hypothetical protein